MNITKVSLKTKLSARAKVKHAVKIGRLVRAAKCEMCLMPYSTLAHHPNYYKPLRVRWLCKRCHAAAHKLMLTEG